MIFRSQRWNSISVWRWIFFSRTNKRIKSTDRFELLTMNEHNEATHNNSHRKNWFALRVSLSLSFVCLSSCLFSYLSSYFSMSLRFSLCQSLRSNIEWDSFEWNSLERSILSNSRTYEWRETNSERENQRIDYKRKEPIHWIITLEVNSPLFTHIEYFSY